MRFCLISTILAGDGCDGQLSSKFAILIRGYFFFGQGLAFSQKEEKNDE